MLRRIGAALVLSAGLAACAQPPQTRTLLEAPLPPELPQRAAVPDVPFFAQEDRWCGPAALATAQGWAGVPISQEEAARQVFTPGSEGTHRDDLVAATRRNGLLAVPVKGLKAVLTEIASGTPVMVFQNLGLEAAPLWHYAVAVGYDLPAREIVLRSGREAERRTALATFERTWARGDHWALAVTPPERLPETASAPDVLRGALGLERAGQTAAAAKAYAAAARRWPDSALAHFGLGNAHLAQEEPAAAISAYRGALTLDPNMAPAWNNLAHALKHKGLTTEAREAASKGLAAAQRAGADLAPYRDTLREVSASP